MIIETAFAQFVGANLAVADLVGGRIVEGLAVQGDKRPFLSYQLDGGDREYHSRGASGLVTARLLLRMEGRSYGQARELYDAVRNAVDGFRGEWGDVVIDSCFLDVGRRATSNPVHGKERGLAAVEAALDITYIESLPTHQTEGNSD